MPGHPSRPIEIRPCWHCRWYVGLTGGGTAALCSHPRCCRVRSWPATGCGCWERLPGVDDEPWAPDGFIGEQPGVTLQARDTP